MKTSTATYDFLNAVLNVQFEVEEEELELLPSMSTGLTVWPASLLLCKYLEHKKSKDDSYLEGTHIIELGAGLGLCGMLCAKYNCASITFTDKSNEVLSMLASNVNLNFNDDRKSKIQIQKVVWGSVTQFEQVYDLVIGYNNVNVELLAHTVSAILAPQHAEQHKTFLYAHVTRDPVLDDKLLNSMKNKNLKCQQIDINRFLDSKDIPHNEYVEKDQLKLWEFRYGKE